MPAAVNQSSPITPENQRKKKKMIFVCPYACGKTFELQRSLQRHVDSVHQRIRYSCPIAGCKSTIARRDWMKRHIRGVHKMDPSEVFAMNPL